jgi:hypothetical protein
MNPPRNRKQRKQRQIVVKRYIEKCFKSFDKNKVIEQLYAVAANISNETHGWHPDSTLWSKVSTIYCINIYRSIMDPSILELVDGRLAIKWVAQYYKQYISPLTERLLKNKLFI